MKLNSLPLTALFWAALVLPPLAAGLFIGFSYDDRLAREKEALAHQAAILREHALRVFEAQQSAIDYIDARIEGMSWEQIRESGRLHALLQELATSSPHIGDIWLIPPDGHTANSSDFFPVPLKTDASERSYFKVLRERDVTYLGEMIRGYLKGDLKFSLSRRRSSDDGSFDGLILITGNIEFFNDFWRRIINEGEIAAIVRLDGEILARHPLLKEPPPKIDLGSPFFDVARDADRGLYENTARTDNVRRIYAVERLGDLPAFIAVGADRGLLLAPWWHQSAVVLAIALFLSFVLSLLVLISRRYQKNLEREMGLRKGAEHKLSATEKHVSALKAAEARLRASEERFRALFETTTQGVLHVDRRFRIIAANPLAQRTLGVGEGDIIGHRIVELGWEAIDENEKSLTPEERPAAIAMRTGEVVKNFEMGLRSQTADTIRWLTVDAVPQWRQGESEPWSAFLLINDVSEQKRAALTEKVLAAEVDHRSKNVLALVQSLVRLTKADSPERLVEAIEGRISALASAHTLLSRSRWGNVNFRDLINEIVQPYRREKSDRIRINGLIFMLRSSATQAMILMLHELATNAAKYGALSVAEGHVDISWELDKENRVLRLLWKESGGPVVKPPQKLSFGSRMIQLAVEGDLGGRVEKHWDPKGLSAVVEVPLSHVSTVVNKESRDITWRPVAEERKSSTCDGCRILVVEDNPIIAEELRDQLERMGCVVEDVVHTVEQAELLAESGRYDAAILDVDIRGQMIFPVAERLKQRGIPLAFCTGFSGLSVLDDRWPNAIVLQKPVTTADLTRAIDALVRDTA